MGFGIQSNGTSSEDFRQGWQFLNRVYLGQITRVDEESGTCNVVIFDGLDTEREDLELPWSGLSMNGHRSSWIRYMPQISSRLSDTVGGGGDMVYVAFGPRNEARILGYATELGAYKDFADVRSSDPAKVPKGDFVDLKQGEWDMRSAGGAHIFGNRSGQLLLAAGPTVQIRLDKQNDEARTEAGLWKFGTGGSFIKLGDVKRTLLPTDFKETSVDEVAPLDPTAGPGQKEYWLHLETRSLPVAAIALVDEQFGAVRDEEGLPHLSDLLQPLRYRRRIWDIGTLQVSPVKLAAYLQDIDALGNQSIQYGLASTSVDVQGGPLTAASASFLSIDASAETTATLSGLVSAELSSDVRASVSGLVIAEVTSEALVQVDAPIVALGLAPVAAANPAVHGTVLLTQLSTLVASILTIAQTMAPLENVQTGDPKGLAWQALATAATAIQVILAIPPGTPASMLSAKVFVE